MWVWLLAALLVIGTWVGGYFLGWSLLAKILLTVGAVLLVVGWLVGRRMRALMKARALERELLKQAEQQALNARPDRRAEILELQVQMQRGLTALKQSRLGSSGSTALYTLPWYMIIGPPGAGKTTALKHSGLGFPFLDPRSGGGVRGVGGTRNCDWWFTNDAILLDTAGRYATESDDHDEWIAFLDTLRKYRSQKPVNGVLVAISVTDLMEATDEQIDSYAKRLRARIDELTTRLQMVVPVYVLFTKVDLVAGFVEFWSDLRKSERAQIWGLTLPLEGADRRDTRRAFDEEFDALVDRLHARAVRRVGAERQPELRQRIYQFPLEFAALKQNLQELLGALFQQNSFQETPILRGIYFTSGTQEGRPIDRVIGGMMRAFNLPPPQGQGAAPAPGQTEGKSYFVTDVFRRVVFPDQHVAARTRAEVRRRLVNRVAFAATALLLAVLLVAPSTYTFAQNMALVADARDVAVRTQKVDWGDSSASVVDKVHKLDDLLERLEQIDGWRKGTEPVPFRLRWGMYSGDDIYEPLRSVYVGDLEKGFASPTRAQLERELSSISMGARVLSVDQYGTYFSFLKAYLEMAEPARIEPDWEPQAMTDAWARALGTTAAADKAAMKPHVGHYVELVQRGEIAPWHVNQDLVNRVRSVLAQTSEADRDYSALVRDANQYISPITRSTVFLGSSFAAYVSSRSRPEAVVRGAFTRAGWENYVRDRLDKERAKRLAQDSWVLGQSEQRGIAQAERALDELRGRYFTDYKNAWSDFLRDLDVRQPQSNSEALEELQSISETEWPYMKLLRVVGDNTRLEPPPSAPPGSDASLKQALADAGAQALQSTPLGGFLGGGDAGAGPAKRPTTPVEDAFQPMVAFGVPAVGDDKPQPTGLSHYVEQIVAKVVAALTDMRDAQGAPPDQKAVTQLFQEAFRSTSELLTASQSSFTRPLLSPLLMNPIRLGYAGVLNDVAGAAGGKWELDVWQKWHDKLEGKYPFADSPQEATLTDYTAFFKPEKGLLWAFYNQYLHDSLERNGEAFVPVARFQHSIKYTPDFLQCYQRGAVITDDTFPANAEAPDVEFDVNLHSVSESVAEVTFDVDGVSKTYKNAPEEWLHAQWPAKEPKKRGASVRVRGFSGLDEEITRPGDFGFFRMIDAATSIEPGTEGGKPGGAPTIVVLWNLRSQKAWVRMDVRPPAAASAFATYLDKRERVFRNYKCPRVVAAGVR